MSDQSPGGAQHEASQAASLSANQQAGQPSTRSIKYRGVRKYTTRIGIWVCTCFISRLVYITVVIHIYLILLTLIMNAR